MIIHRNSLNSELAEKAYYRVSLTSNCPCCHAVATGILDFVNKVLLFVKNESWTRGPPALGGPLDFVHPCPMVVTPLPRPSLSDNDEH